MQKKYRSQLKHHHLVLLSSATHITEFGFPAILKVSIDDLNGLQSNGVYIHDKLYSVCFVSFLGDNLGSHLIGGFTRGFNSSRPCLYCMITKPRLKTITASKDCVFLATTTPSMNLLCIEGVVVAKKTKLVVIIHAKLCFFYAFNLEFPSSSRSFWEMLAVGILKKSLPLSIKASQLIKSLNVTVP